MATQRAEETSQSNTNSTDLRFGAWVACERPAAEAAAEDEHPAHEVNDVDGALNRLVEGTVQ